MPRCASDLYQLVHFSQKSKGLVHLRLVGLGRAFALLSLLPTHLCLGQCWVPLLVQVSPKFLGEAALGFAAIKTSPLATKCLRRHKMRQSGNILCPGTPQSCGTPK